MARLTLSVVAQDGGVRASFDGKDEVTLAWRGTYEPGDRIVVECDEDPARLVMRLDECLAESHVTLAGGRFEFLIPFDAAQKGYGQGRAFGGERHWCRVRVEDPREAGAWRDVALNAHDLPLAQGEPVCLLPHASTNVVCDNPQFIARNAIDGVHATELHGSWPHESWGINGNPDAWLLVEFAGPVVADELRLYLRADFPHDTWWKSARVELSDGSDLPLELVKTGAAQRFDLGGRTIEWLRLYDLQRAEPDGFPGLTALEVWGRRAS